LRPIVPKNLHMQRPWRASYRGPTAPLLSSRYWHPAISKHCFEALKRVGRNKQRVGCNKRSMLR
jgi:hypothetical protein